MKTHPAVEASFLRQDLSQDLKEKVTLFLTNSNLDKLQQKDIIELLEDVWHEAFAEGMID